MVLPNEFEDRNRLILSYLLAQLPQEKTVELDEEMLTQPESLSLFEEGLADMMDAYADRTLDAASALRVEELLRLHPSAQRQLSFARALGASRDVSASKIGDSGSIRLKNAGKRRGGWLLPWTRITLITAVAAILLVLVAGVFLVRRGAVRGNAENAARSGTTASAPVTTKSEAASPVFTVILLPTVLRGAPVKAVKIPAEASSVRLQAVLPAGSTAAASTLRLANADGEDVRVFSGLSTEKLETDTYVEVSLPATQLPPGNYRVSLTGPDGKQIAVYRMARGR